MQRKALEGRPVQGIGDSWVRSLSPPPSGLPELRKPSPIEKRPFLRGFLTPIFEFPVSADNNHRSGGFLASGLCVQKFRSRRHRFERHKAVWRFGGSESCEAKNAVSSRVATIAGSIRAPRTAGSILQEHHEVVRLRCRGANGLRQQL